MSVFEYIFKSQIKVSKEARAREPYGSRGDDETECLTKLIKQYANFTVKKRNLARGIQQLCYPESLTLNYSCLQEAH